MDDFYRENILDYARNRRHYGLLDPNSIDYADDNPLCGDHIHLTLRVDENGVIIGVGWEGSGCAISQASASMLYETLPGRTLEDVRHLDKEELLDMLGIPLSAQRMKCALLSLKVLKGGAYGLSAWPDEDDE
ncbi:MAG: iron-sulfur cluster assembly scaffold protein [Anaerolineae bacterium]|nr:iron-sulfur cluster assembly scaffold protein [Anaerolineae bacterium]